MATIFSALELAAHGHARQRRKGGDDIPYINHPIAVAALLATVGGVTDPDILTAAVLHDVVEDTTTTAAELEAQFGARIASLVAEVTDDPALDGPARKLTQEREAPSKSPGAKLIRLADKTCNVRDITANPPHTWPAERCTTYFDWCERVVAQLRGTHPALEAAFADAIVQARIALP